MYNIICCAVNCPLHDVCFITTLCVCSFCIRQTRVVATDESRPPMRVRFARRRTNNNIITREVRRVSSTAVDRPAVRVSRMAAPSFVAVRYVSSTVRRDDVAQCDVCHFVSRFVPTTRGCDERCCRHWTNKTIKKPSR